MDKERSKAPRRAGLEGGNRFESASPSHRDIRLSDSSRSGTEREPCSPKTDKRVNIGHFLCIPRFPLLSPFTQHSLFPHAFADDWCARINQSAVENGKSPKDEMSITIEGGGRLPALPLQCIDGTRTKVLNRTSFWAAAKPSSYLPQDFRRRRCH